MVKSDLQLNLKMISMLVCDRLCITYLYLVKLLLSFYDVFFLVLATSYGG